REPLAIDGLHFALPVAVEDEAACHEAGSQSLLESLERTIQAIDGTARSTGCRLIHGDRQEALVSPVTGSRQRRSVRMPFGEKLVHLAQEQIGGAFVEILVGAEHPDARVIGEVL